MFYEMMYKNESWSSFTNLALRKSLAVVLVVGAGPEPVVGVWNKVLVLILVGSLAGGLSAAEAAA